MKHPITFAILLGAIVLAVQSCEYSETKQNAEVTAHLTQVTYTSQVDSEEDFSDSGVGCTDDCLDAMPEFTAPHN